MKNKLCLVGRWLAGAMLCFLSVTEGVVGQSSTLFELLSPQETGIAFENTITDEKDHNILLYSNYYGGAGTGIGDFNKDGLQDVFFAGNLVNDALYFNLGDLHFQDGTQLAHLDTADGWSSGVLVFDVNQDGWDDIYVTRELYDESPVKRRNKLYINQGYTFDLKNGQRGVSFIDEAEKYGLASDERTRHAGLVDFDRDGRMDIFLLNQPPNPGNYSSFFGVPLMQNKWAPRLMRNDESGKFVDVTEKAGVLKPGYANSIVSGDFNKDGWPDLYICHDYEAPDNVYINNGDGTFTDRMTEWANHISFYAMGVDAGDLNNDGWLEIMTLDMVAEDNFRLKANMSAMNPKTFWKVVDEGGHYQYMYNAVHINQGGKKWSDAAQMSGMASTDWSWSNLIADFDLDGWNDVFVTNGLLRDIRNSDAAKSFPNYVNEAVNKFIAEHPNAGDVSIFDILNLDEALDHIPSVPLQNYAFKNNGDLSFSKVMDDWGLSEKTFSNGSAYADLDNDGDLELIVNNINQEAFVYKNNAVENKNGGWFAVKIVDPTNNRSPHGTKIQINCGEDIQYRELTNVRGMYSTSQLVAHFGLGNREKIDRLTIAFPDERTIEYIDVEVNRTLTIDMSKDYSNKADMSVEDEISIFKKLEMADRPLSFVHRENLFDDYEKQILLPHKMSQMGPALAIADINDDGLEDVFFGGASGQNGQIFIQREGGKFAKMLIDDDPVFEDVDATFFDYDGDKDMDLYVVSGGNAHAPDDQKYQDRLYENEGGFFRKIHDALPEIVASGSVVRPMDFDGDGDLDLFVGGRHIPWDYPTPCSSYLLENIDGRFVDVTNQKAKMLDKIGLVTDAVWTDMDTDGDADLIVVGEWMAPTIFENEGGKFKKINTDLDKEIGWWNAIEKVDADQDGDDDYLLGNLGLNYKYQASEKSPFEVYYDDFDGSGEKDIVLSYYNFGEQFPLRGRSCSSQQIPGLKEKFPSYNEFAGANINSVYGLEALGNSLHYSAINFAHVYIENKGNGQFELKQLPSMAQLSCVNDFEIGDFNGDGQMDVLGVQNMFQAEIETPRNDAGMGILLLGDGRGNWGIADAEKAGLYISLDAKNVESMVIDGEQYIIVAVNDGQSLMLRLSRSFEQSGG